jgi:hypothetical protein
LAKNKNWFALGDPGRETRSLQDDSIEVAIDAKLKTGIFNPPLRRVLDTRCFVELPLTAAAHRKAIHRWPFVL